MQTCANAAVVDDIIVVAAILSMAAPATARTRSATVGLTPTFGTFSLEFCISETLLGDL